MRRYVRRAHRRVRRLRKHRCRRPTHHGDCRPLHPEQHRAGARGMKSPPRTRRAGTCPFRARFRCTLTRPHTHNIRTYIRINVDPDSAVARSQFRSPLGVGLRPRLPRRGPAHLRQRRRTSGVHRPAGRLPLAPVGHRQPATPPRRPRDLRSAHIFAGRRPLGILIGCARCSMASQDSRAQRTALQRLGAR